MEHFKEIGTIIYLKISFDVLSKRLKDVKNRGVVLRENQTIRDIYDERTLLYEKYADVVVDVSKCSIEEAVEMIMKILA